MRAYSMDIGVEMLILLLPILRKNVSQAGEVSLSVDIFGPRSRTRYLHC